MSELIKKLAMIQKNLNAPKNQFNKFGGYKYRSCEDILMAVKPLLGELVLSITDDIEAVGGRVYVKATATVTDGKDSHSVSAYAREAETKKGMDDSQITGSTSSYARKYALNGLFAIDDSKDADHSDNRNDNSATPINAEQADHIYALIQQTGTDQSAFMNYMGVVMIEEIKAGQYGKAVAALEKKRKAQA